MRIAPIPPQQNFKSCLRTYTKPIDRFTEMQIHTSTWMFREDMKWMKLLDFMKKSFQECKNINIYVTAASDGSEAYSLAILLLENAPELAKKAFPIFASDQDLEMVKAFNTGRINLCEEDKNRIKLFTKKIFFTDAQKRINIPNENGWITWYDRKAYKPIPELARAIQYEQGDILETLKNIKDDGNTLFMCRNAGGYISTYYVKKICETAQKVLKKGSLFAIGGTDFISGLPYALPEHGFEEIIKDILYRKL